MTERMRDDQQLDGFGDAEDETLVGGDRLSVSMLVVRMPECALTA
ncbi:MAG: hypothetical protein ACRD0Z_03205 [Acidimicrobiales bacterium]